MKVNSHRDIPFKSIYTNKAVKKGFEFAASNGALFGASATVAFSVCRPLTILLTPKTNEENRKIAAAKSITSSILNFILMLAISVPLAKSIKKIDDNPAKYLSESAIKNLKDSGNNITGSKGYEFATQLFKLGVASLVAVPKAFLTAAGLPYIVDAMDSKKSNNSDVSFKGKSTDKTADFIGNIISKKGMLKFIDKYKNSNFPMHITALTDIISTLAFMHQANNSHKIDDKRKKTLLYNAGISTSLSIAGGYTLDKLLDSTVQKFIDKYKIINKNDKNLSKQLQGIKIAKPFLILGTIYYIFIPLISTFLAERADKSNKS